MTDKYPTFGDDWRARWQVLPSWQKMHRVAYIAWINDLPRCAHVWMSRKGTLMNNLRLKLRTRIFFWRLRRWITPPARPMMGELVKYQQRQFSALSNSQRLALYINKRAQPDYRTRTFFRAWSGKAQGESK